MILSFSEQGWEDCQEWQRLDPRMLERINGLLLEIARTPYVGMGKPEALRHELSGWWSRRITDEHRLVYRVTEGTVLVAQCRHRY